MYQALYRKYRPRRFEDVVGQEHITGTLRRQVAAGRTSHAYLFVGTRGTGKTTCAKILSRALNCLHPVDGDPCNQCEACRGIESGAILDVVEIDAASNNGVDNIRAIRDEAVYTPAEVRKRVYIIDEVHMLSTSAFNALLKILEEPPEHLVFILATTELNKVPATILSRCQHFSFRRIAPEDIAKRLLYVASQEGFTLTEGAAALLSRLADGSMRDALSLLDQCAASDTVDEAAVMASVGLMGTENTVRLWQALTRDDLSGALALFDKLYYGGAESVSVLNDLLSLLRDMLVIRVAPEGGKAMLTGAFDAGRLTELSAGVDTGRLLAAAEALQEAADTMRDARDKRVKTELTLMKLAGTLAGSYRAPAAYAPAEAPQTAPKAPEIAARAPEKPQKPAYEAPPVEDMDAPPPWEDADIPPEPEEYTPEPVRPEPRPQSQAPAAPEPRRADPAPAPTEDTGWWGSVLKRCEQSLEGGGYTFLANPDNVSPELLGQDLVLHAKNAFVRMMVDTSQVKAAVTKAVLEVLGHGVNVAVAVGMPDKAAPAKDSLDELAKFDGIVKFK